MRERERRAPEDFLSNPTIQMISGTKWGLSRARVVRLIRFYFSEREEKGTIGEREEKVWTEGSIKVLFDRISELNLCDFRSLCLLSLVVSRRTYIIGNVREDWLVGRERRGKDDDE